MHAPSELVLVGRQVNFFMTDGDEGQFLDFVMKSGKVVLLPRVAPNVPFEPVQVPPKSSAEYPASWPYFFFNYSVSSNLITKRVTKPDKDGYYLDFSNSSVIEYSHCTRQGNILYPGRIWAKFEYLDEQTKSFRRKEAQFEKWYESLSRWLESRYKPLTYTAKMTGKRFIVGIAGPNALSFFEKGGILAMNGIGLKKGVEGKCPVCGNSLEEEFVLLNGGSTKVIHKCINLTCTYLRDVP